MPFGYADTGSIEPGSQAQGLLRPAVHLAAPAQVASELLAGGKPLTGVLPRGCDGVGVFPKKTWSVPYNLAKDVFPWEAIL